MANAEMEQEVQVIRLGGNVSVGLSRLSPPSSVTAATPAGRDVARPPLKLVGDDDRAVWDTVLVDPPRVQSSYRWPLVIGNCQLIKVEELLKSAGSQGVLHERLVTRHFDKPNLALFFDPFSGDDDSVPIQSNILCGKKQFNGVHPHNKRFDLLIGADIMLDPPKLLKRR
ncbi:hypothetical protein KEM48_014340 [Puccinia striiformis f. sp. tritici PST-130]|nr:hypothetical protein KEM48_014340 [Puccinia striiformis f. sp. tritici PST-130]